ncbi:unnamed protein product [Cercopithifilaria johnstoni]|uniref:Uncharacterized protein n=1 Tax=Cercopithifilaria johnstoni TaxID=2874296 RepID=A0A8J2LYK8_9BILA|nr:unnamed protein product [Cercopithifilaria johnstoni]
MMGGLLNIKKKGQWTRTRPKDRRVAVSPNDQRIVPLDIPLFISIISNRTLTVIERPKVTLPIGALSLSYIPNFRFLLMWSVKYSIPHSGLDFRISLK